MSTPVDGTDAPGGAAAAGDDAGGGAGAAGDDARDGARAATGRRPRVGALGAGQLARMDLAPAAALDVDLVVLAGSEDDAAARAGATTVVGDHHDLETLRAFARDVDVITFEFEGVDPALLDALQADGVRLVPSPQALLFCQDKLHQRRRLGRAGFPVPPFEHVHVAIDVAEFAARFGWPVVLKAPRGGYDGRGVALVDTPTEAAAFLQPLPDGAVAEPRLEIERELAVQVVRTGGETAVYPVVETVQVDAMLRELIAPAPIPRDQAEAAQDLARRIAEHVDAQGLTAVELFATPDGLLVNELAMRPHNSGHHTIEATTTSQFEQHVRAALDWPPGSTDLVAPAAVTVNVVGPSDGSDPRDRLPQALTVAGAHVHLYGKAARPGRKLGHVTALAPDVDTARATAWRAAEILEGSSA